MRTQPRGTVFKILSFCVLGESNLNPHYNGTVNGYDLMFRPPPTRVSAAVYKNGLNITVNKKKKKTEDEGEQQKEEVEVEKEQKKKKKKKKRSPKTTSRKKKRSTGNR
jgi:hypothetical protein